MGLTDWGCGGSKELFGLGGMLKLKRIGTMDWERENCLHATLYVLRLLGNTDWHYSRSGLTPYSGKAKHSGIS
jgi:hypothetical protein